MVGQTISHYKILEKLGEGGMGVVYKADDTKLRRAVALKFLAPDKTRDVEAKKRFMHEAQAASALDHPNIAIVHEIDETNDGRSFICMAYYPGQTLKEKIEAGPLPIEQTIDIALQIANGLQRAHEAKIIHRDIKPANVIITERGEVKIVDFGIAKLAGQTRPTSSGATAGTAAYMSPEQAQGSEVDHRSDLFSLGIVLYEMVTGKRPFQGEHESALLYSIVCVDPLPPSSLRPELPQEFERVILRLLEKDPSKRYQSAAEFRLELRKVRKLYPSSTTTQFGGEEPFVLADTLNRFGHYLRERKVSFKVLPKRHVQVSILTAGVLAGVCVALVIGLILLLAPAKHGEELQTQALQKIRLVVMYFENQTGDPELHWLSRGIADMLINDLSHSKYLEMVSMDRMFNILRVAEHRGTSTLGEGATAEVARRTNAEIITAGSYVKAGNVFRIMAQIRDVRTDQILRTERVEGNGLERIFDMVDELSSRIKLALEIQAAGEEKRAEKIIQTDTRSVEAYKYYIEGREQINRLMQREAIEPLTKAIKIDSTFARAYLSLTHVYDVLGEDDLALKAVEKAMGLSTGLPQVDQLMIALQYAQLKGDWNSEIEILAKLSLLQPSEPLWHSKIGWHLTTHKRMLEQGINSYKKAIEIDPVGDPLDYYYLGYALLNAGRGKEAVETFEKLVSIRPQDAFSHDGLGNAYTFTGDYAKAEREFTTALKLKPTFFESHRSLGDLYLTLRLFRQAYHHYERFRSQAVGKNLQESAHYRLARFYLVSRDIPKAIQEANKSLSLDPFMMLALWIKGLVFLEVGTVDSAETVVRQMEDFFQKSSSFYRKEYLIHLRGSVHLKRGRFDDAIRELKDAEAFGPYDHALFRLAVAEAYLAQGLVDQAVEACNWALEFNPRYPPAHWQLAQLYERQKKREEAIEAYQKVIEICRHPAEESMFLTRAKERLADLMNQK